MTQTPTPILKSFYFDLLSILYFVIFPKATNLILEILMCFINRQIWFFISIFFCNDWMCSAKSINFQFKTTSVYGFWNYFSWVCNISTTICKQVDVHYQAQSQPALDWSDLKICSNNPVTHLTIYQSQRSMRI